MSTLDDVFRQRWQAINKKIPYVPENGIPTFWRQHPELGSPLGFEVDIENGAVGQAFTGAVVVWDATSGARIAVE